jgi:hypothetical protein
MQDMSLNDKRLGKKTPTNYNNQYTIATFVCQDVLITSPYQATGQEFKRIIRKEKYLMDNYI